MQETLTMTSPDWGLPDPDTAPEFYADVPTKRFIAWVIDSILIAALTAIAVPFTAFIGLFFLPVLFLVLGFFYRWISISRRSATPGMRLTSIEFRTRDGRKFDTAMAALHTAGYTISVSVFPLQLVSIVLMLASSRKQGLSDHILGTAAINRAAAE